MSEEIKGHGGVSTREGSKPDSFDVGGVNHNNFGSTCNDNNDMERMGKTQELRVGYIETQDQR